MKKAMVVRVGKGIGGPLVERLLEVGVEVVAYSGSERKLSALKEATGHSPHLHTVHGEAWDPERLLAAAADGVDVIFCGVHLNYDENPDKVRRMLEAVEQAAEKTGAKRVTIEGIYRPSDEEDQAERPHARHMRLISPELYGAGVSDTIVHYGLRKIAEGKKVKLLTHPETRREYLYAADAARDAVELAFKEDAFGKIWRLRGGSPVTEEEWIRLAGSVIHTIPRMDRMEGWKLKWLQWHEPRIMKILAGYDRGINGSHNPVMDFTGNGGSTPYETGIAETIAAMRKKQVMHG